MHVIKNMHVSNIKGISVISSTDDLQGSTVVIITRFRITGVLKLHELSGILTQYTTDMESFGGGISMNITKCVS